MNLMYFKNLRGDRDGGTTGLLSGSRRVTAGFDGGGGSSVGPSGGAYSGVRGIGVGAGTSGANTRSWFNAAVAAGGVAPLGRPSGAGGPGVVNSAHPGTASAAATGAGSTLGGTTLSSAGTSGASSEMQHLRTHPLGLFDLGSRHADSGGGGGVGGGYDDGDRSLRSNPAAPSSSNSRWGHHYSEREMTSGNGRSSEYRYTRVDRQQSHPHSQHSSHPQHHQQQQHQRSLDSSVAEPSGSRSVRSGLYDTEVCLSVSGLGNVRGTMVSGRTGKQVSFGRHSPDGNGVGGGVGGTMERERGLVMVDKRSSRTSAGGPSGSICVGGVVMSNKENNSGESRSTFPRSSIVASKRPSPERLLADPRSSGSGRTNSSRDDSADSRRRRPTTIETSLSIPDGRHLQHRSSGRNRDVANSRDANNRLSVNDPSFDELIIDPKDLNLNEISRDCFIIPVHLVNRFLPLGVTLPQVGRASMSVLEVDDPQLVILLHFMTPFMAIQPVFESPLARPASLQGSLASQLLIDLLRDRPGAHGMLLVSIEQDVDYPYINYGVAARSQTNGEEWQQMARMASLERFEPQNLGYFSDHLVDVYEEAATITRPPLQPSCRRPVSNKTGYIVCVYKVFEGDDGEKFERNWLYWTGAKILYQCVPRCVGLRRITLHKSVSAGDKLYTLMCECSSFIDHLQEAAYIAPALRARLCGYWSIYRVADVY